MGVFTEKHRSEPFSAQPGMLGRGRLMAPHATGSGTKQDPLGGDLYLTDSSSPFAFSSPSLYRRFPFSAQQILLYLHRVTPVPCGQTRSTLCRPSRLVPAKQVVFLKKPHANSKLSDVCCKRLRTSAHQSYTSNALLAGSDVTHAARGVAAES